MTATVLAPMAFRRLGLPVGLASEKPEVKAVERKRKANLLIPAAVPVKPRPQLKARKEVENGTPRNGSESLESRLAEHYSHMMNFIRTRAEPILFYLPKTHTPETRRCLEESQDTISQKIQVLAAHLGEDSEEKTDSGARRVSLTPAKP